MSDQDKKHPAKAPNEKKSAPVPQLGKTPRQNGYRFEGIEKAAPLPHPDTLFLHALCARLGALTAGWEHVRALGAEVDAGHARIAEQQTELRQGYAELRQGYAEIRRTLADHAEQIQRLREAGERAREELAQLEEEERREEQREQARQERERRARPVRLVRPHPHENPNLSPEEREHLRRERDKRLLRAFNEGNRYQPIAVLETLRQWFKKLLKLIAKKLKNLKTAVSTVFTPAPKAAPTVTLFSEKPNVAPEHPSNKPVCMAAAAA